MKAGGFLFPLLSVVDFAEVWWVGVQGEGGPKSTRSTSGGTANFRPGTYPGPEHLQQEQRKENHPCPNRSGIQNCWTVKL